jgi:hypothetical protein
MAITPELMEKIDKEMLALTEDDYRRPGTSINKFIDDLSGNLAQANFDLIALANAGFDASNMPYYNALLEMLSLVHAERRGIVTDTPEKRAYFDKQIVEAELDKKRLMVVAGHIVEMTGSKKLQRNYRVIAEGSGYVDMLNDVLALVSMVLGYPKYSSQIKPGGVEITDAYCKDASNRAVELLLLKGYVVEHGVPQNKSVDWQNRIVTLCLRAQSDIKKFANAAFFEKLDYYNSNYASDSRRKDNSGELEIEEKENLQTT